MGNVVLFDHIDTAFTYLNQDTGLFKVVNAPLRDSIQEYVETAGKTAREQKEYFTGPLGNDVFQCSPMPWISYMHISHTNSGKKDNATPAGLYCKFTEGLKMLWRHFFSPFFMEAFCGMQAAISIFSIFAVSMIQQNTPGELIGKIMAYTAAVTMCAQPVGQMVYGFLFDRFHGTVYLVLIPSGIMVCMIGLYAEWDYVNNTARLRHYGLIWMRI